jgi:hypothetical protein
MRRKLVRESRKLVYDWGKEEVMSRKTSRDEVRRKVRGKGTWYIREKTVSNIVQWRWPI